MRTLSIAALAASALAFAAPASAQVWVNGQQVQPGAGGVWTSGPAVTVPPPPMVSPNPPHVAGPVAPATPQHFVWGGGFVAPPTYSYPAASAHATAHADASMRWGGRINGRWYAGAHAPGGWRAYRRPTRGWALPRYWRAPGFYITDYWSYGLGAPPGGYSWVRYYDDAVLIDGRGHVWDARYGIDWDGGYRGYEPYPYFSRDEAVAGGALAGAAGGAIAGAAIGGPGGALIGAGLGALLGGGIGTADYEAQYGHDRGGTVTYEAPPPAPGYAPAPGYGSAPGCGAVYPAPPPGYAGAGCTSYPGGGYAPPAPYAPPAGHMAYGGCGNWCGGGFGYGYGYGGGSTTTVVVSSAPVVTTTTTVIEEVVEEVVTYETVRSVQRARPKRVYRAKPRRKSCDCTCTVTCR